MSARVVLFPATEGSIAGERAGNEIGSGATDQG